VLRDFRKNKKSPQKVTFFFYNLFNVIIMIMKLKFNKYWIIIVGVIISYTFIFGSLSKNLETYVMSNIEEELTNNY